MFLEWDRLEGMVVNEAINLPGYLYSVKTVSNLHLTIIEKPQPWSVWSPFNCSSWIPQENELKLSNYAVPFSNLRFSLFLVRQVLEWSWSLSRYSAQESSGRHHFRPCTSFPLRGHLLPLLLSPTRRPRCQGLHLHVHASSNVRIFLSSNPRIDNLPPPGLRRWTPIGRWCPPSPTSPTSTMPWSSTSRSALFASLLSSPLRYHLYISEAFDNQNIFLQFLRRDKSRIPWAQKLELVNKIF